MHMKTWLNSALVTALLSVASLPLMAQQQQQNTSQQQTGDPVADAARKARQKEKTEPKPKKVYTNDDISTSHPDAPNQPASTSEKPPTEGAPNAQGAAGNAAAGTQGAAGEDKKDSEKDEEAKWRKRFKEIHTKIADAQKELDVLQREGQKAQLQYYPDPQKALNQQYNRKDVNETNAKIEAKKQEIDQLKQTLSDMEDQLRKSGGDPGWASE
jgi:chromosome segregation ATPase